MVIFMPLRLIDFLAQIHWKKKDKMRFVYLYLLQDIFMLSVSIEKQKA